MHRPAAPPPRRDRQPASRDPVRDARRHSRRRAGRSSTPHGPDRRRHLRTACQRRRALRRAARRRPGRPRPRRARDGAERHALVARHGDRDHRRPADDDAPASVMALVPARLADLRAPVDVEAPRPPSARLRQAGCRAHPVAHRHRPGTGTRGAQARHPDHRHEPRDGREHPRLHHAAARPESGDAGSRVGGRQTHVRHDTCGDDADPQGCGLPRGDDRHPRRDPDQLRDRPLELSPRSHSSRRQPHPLRRTADHREAHRRPAEGGRAARPAARRARRHRGRAATSARTWRRSPIRSGSTPR